MKVSETFKEEDDKIIIKKTHDLSGILRDMEHIRSQGIDSMNGGNRDNRFIGRIPTILIEEWLKEAGVKWDDVHARGEVIKRKILSGDFDKFRSDWKGRY